MVTQAKLDALAKAQVDAAEQTKVDKEAHRALIDEGIKTARAAQDAAEAAKRGASKAWNEAQTAKEQAAIEQAKVNTALAQLALAQTAAEERHTMHQASHTKLLQMLTNSAEIRMDAAPNTANVREIRDKLEGQAGQPKFAQGEEWCAFELQLKSWGVGWGHEAELHEMLVAVAADTAGHAVRWTVPAPTHEGAVAEADADGSIAVARTQIDTGAYANAQHETNVGVGEYERSWQHGSRQQQFSSADARALADMRRPPRPPKPRGK